VGFYGDYRRILKDAGHEDVAEELDGIVEATAHHASRRLLFGLFAEDAVNVILNYTADRIEKGENLPSRDEIIAHYYGEFIPPVDIFIGMSRFAAYDMPLLSTGREDLYFLAAPTLYLQEEEIRRILYDHIFARPTADSYEDFEGAGWDFMQTYYAKNRKRIFGIGSQQYGMWYPDI
jgi:hypothetical protein